MARKRRNVLVFPAIKAPFPKITPDDMVNSSDGDDDFGKFIKSLRKVYQSWVKRRGASKN
jgi:hypothetical protein